MPDPELQAHAERVESLKKVVESFVVGQKQLLRRRGESAERLLLNERTLKALRRSLELAEAELRRCRHRGELG
jgi:hypothetical protein